MLSAIGQCQRLAILSARGNRLEELPEEIGLIQRLSVVNFASNCLSTLPVSMLKLNLSALWLAEGQNKSLVPLQIERDPVTTKHCLVCFLLPQTSRSQDEECKFFFMLVFSVEGSLLVLITVKVAITVMRCDCLNFLSKNFYHNIYLQTS